MVHYLPGKVVLFRDEGNSDPRADGNHAPALGNMRAGWRLLPTTCSRLPPEYSSMPTFSVLRPLIARLVPLICLGMLLAPAVHAHPVGERLMVARNPHAVSRNADGSDQVRVTAWYPTSARETAEAMVVGTPAQPLMEGGTAVPGSPPPMEGRWPVVLLSHGYGGAARSMGWFATAIAAQGYVVIAVDHPGNNGRDPMTKAGAAYFFERPGDLVAAYRHVAKDPVLAGAIADGPVAVAGFSAGGFTTLALAGGQVEPARLRRFCDERPDDGVCRPQIEFPLPIGEVLDLLESKAARQRIAAIARERNGLDVRAAFVMAPAIVQAFSPRSLEKVRVRTTIVIGTADTVAPNETNGTRAAELIDGSTLQPVRDSTHYDFLGTCTPHGRDVMPLCAKQARPAEAHEVAIAAALGLFGAALPRGVQTE